MPAGYQKVCILGARPVTANAVIDDTGDNMVVMLTTQIDPDDLDDPGLLLSMNQCYGWIGVGLTPNEAEEFAHAIISAAARARAGSTDPDR